MYHLYAEKGKQINTLEEQQQALLVTCSNFKQEKRRVNDELKVLTQSLHRLKDEGGRLQEKINDTDGILLAMGIKQVRYN